MTGIEVPANLFSVWKVPTRGGESTAVGDDGVYSSTEIACGAHAYTLHNKYCCISVFRLGPYLTLYSIADKSTTQWLSAASIGLIQAGAGRVTVAHSI